MKTLSTCRLQRSSLLDSTCLSVLGLFNNYTLEHTHQAKESSEGSGPKKSGLFSRQVSSNDQI